MANSKERRRQGKALMHADGSGKAFDIALLCLGFAVGIVFFLVEKTPVSVSLSLAALFLCLIHPTLNLVPWLANAPPEKRIKRKSIGIAILLMIVFGFGVLVWPKPSPHVPEFVAKFNKIAVAEGLIQREGESEEKDFSVLMLALVSLHNTGDTSSATENFRLSAELSNGVRIRHLYPEVSRNPKWTFNYQGKPAVILEKSWLYDRAAKPLAPGSITCGWLMFIIPNVKYDQFKNLSTTWTLTFNDAMLKYYSVKQTTSGYSSPKLHFDPCAGEDFMVNPGDFK